eukprot:2772882-Rhodomonas_salina.1
MVYAYYQVGLDTRSNYTAGYELCVCVACNASCWRWKYNHWEQKGVPVRLELGPKDLEKKQVCVRAKRTRPECDCARCACARASACVRACVRAPVRACACVCVRVRVCACARTHAETQHPYPHTHTRMLRPNTRIPKPDAPNRPNPSDPSAGR